MVFFVIFFSFLTFSHRVFVYFFDLIPHDKSYYFSFFSGFASDFSIIFLVSFSFCLLLFLFKKKEKFLAFLMSFVALLFYTIHIRYVDYFGMQLRAFHAFSTGTLPFFPSLLMIFDSWISLAYFAFSLIIGIFIWFKTRKNFFERKFVSGIIFLCCYLVSNALWIQMRKRNIKDDEIQASPLVHFFYDVIHYNNKEARIFPHIDELKKIRTFLGEERVYASDSYPLWQRKLPDLPLVEKDKDFFYKLKNFIDEEEVKHGPWNVVLILSESLRAFEFESFGLNDPSYNNLTHYLTKLSKE